MPHASLTRDAVASHNKPDDVWCIIDHKVYDLTDFLDAHPGGSVVLEQIAGTDATSAFYNLHRQEVLQKYSSLCIGTLEGEKSEVIVPQPGELSPVPYAEPLWLRPQFKSPYFKESHRELRKKIREFVDRYVTPEAQEKEKDGTYISQELIDRMAEHDLLAMRLGPGKHLHGKNLMGVVKGEEFDYLHDMVQAQEFVRANARGFQDGNMAGMMISLTAVLQWMRNEQLKQKVAAEVLSGKKKMCLAITEAFAGSDVAGLRTTATKTPDGKHYIIRGTKKWITNGMFCDYFVVGCKTEKGFSVILVPRSDAVETSLIKTSYSTTAGTAFVEFNDAKVPVDHLLGEEDKGFIVISKLHPFYPTPTTNPAVSNFNHERFMMCCGVIRQSRSVVEECLKWCNQRIVFGKKLIEQPAIRQK
jgi:alkylation response protein AidB-like acyl-CoA dehydrogenase